MTNAERAKDTGEEAQGQAQANAGADAIPDHFLLDVVERAAVLVSGWPVLAAFDELFRAVPAAWEQVRASLPKPPEGYAEASVELGDGRYHELVGVLVGPDDATPGPVTVQLPAGIYLHTRYEGPLEGITDAFQTMITNAPTHGYRVGMHKLDVGYTFTVREANARHEAHDLWLQVHPATSA